MRAPVILLGCLVLACLIVLVLLNASPVAMAAPAAMAKTKARTRGRIDERSRSLYDEGYRVAGQGELAQAITLFKQAIEADPENFIAVFDLGGALEETDDRDGALVQYERTVALQPDFSEAHTQLGTLYLLHRKDPERALASFRTALLITNPYVDPRFPLAQTRGQALLNLAVAYAQVGRLGLAEGIGKSLFGDPTAVIEREKIAALVDTVTDDLVPRRTRSPAYQETLDAIRRKLHAGQTAEALAEYERFVAAHPAPAAAPATAETTPEPAQAALLPADRWDLYEGLGLAYANSGRLGDAAQAFVTARDAAQPIDYRWLLESLYNLACAQASLHQTSEALGTLEEVLWIEHITRYDAPERPRYGEKILQGKDPSLAPLRKNKTLAALLARYGVVSRPAAASPRKR